MHVQFQLGEKKSTKKSRSLLDLMSFSRGVRGGT